MGGLEDDADRRDIISYLDIISVPRRVGNGGPAGQSMGKLAMTSNLSGPAAG